MPIAVIGCALSIVFFLPVNLIFFFAPFEAGIYPESPAPGTSVNPVQPYPYPKHLRVMYDIHTRTRTFYFRPVCRVHTKPCPGFLPRVLPYKEFL